jgi:HEAT repeat protein
MFDSLNKYISQAKTGLEKFGDTIYKGAVSSLYSAVSNGRKGSIFLLCELYLHSKNTEEKKLAEKTLCQLDKDNSISEFCSFWARTRNPNLEHILNIAQYNPKQSLNIYVLTALKLNKLDRINSNINDLIVPLIAALCDRDLDISSKSKDVLSNLSDTAAIKSFCTEWDKSRNQLVEDILLNKQYSPDSPQNIHIITSLKLNKTSNLLSIGPEAVNDLVNRCSDIDSVVKRNAEDVLLHLLRKDTINMLCQKWNDERSPLLDRIILKTCYIADDPFSLRIITSLKVNKIDGIDTADVEIVKILIKLLNDKDPTIIKNAQSTLSTAKIEGDIFNLICQRWAKDHDPKLRQLVLDSGLIPDEPLDLKVIALAKKGMMKEVLDIKGIQVIRILVDLLDDDDDSIKNHSYKVLSSLFYQEKINELCDIWAKSRKTILEKIITDSKYAASYPPETAIMTMLMAGDAEMAISEGVKAIDLFVSMAGDKNVVIAESALKALRLMSDPDMIARFCSNYSNCRDANVVQIVRDKETLIKAPVKQTPIEAPVKQTGLLFLETTVAGVTYENRQRYVKNLQVGDKVFLEHEPENPFDYNAIAVYDNRHNKLGYIPKDISPHYVHYFSNRAISGSVKGVGIASGTSNYGLSIKIYFMAKQNNSESGEDIGGDPIGYMQDCYKGNYYEE